LARVLRERFFHYGKKGGPIGGKGRKNFNRQIGQAGGEIAAEHRVINKVPSGLRGFG